MPSPLASIRVEGFRSIASMTLDFSSNVTLLIGANGAGKSNVIDALALVGEIVDRHLREYIVNSGGFSAILHRSPSAPARQVEITVWGEWSPSGPASRFRNGYTVVLSPGPDDTAVIRETTRTHENTHKKPYENGLGIGTESRLPDILDEHPANRYLHGVLTQARVFHFDDTGRSSAPPLRQSDLANGDTLMEDARNIAAVLYSMKENHQSQYDAVLRSVRNVAPFFDDFVLVPSRNDKVQLRWRERGLDDVFPGSALSSGTLRFLCLSVLLQQPSPPATIILDEPELGLHPTAIHQLAALFRIASEREGVRVVAATQSVSLLGQFSIDEVAVVERHGGSTVVERPSAERLGSWLEDYSVGELWEMNLLGGRPDAVPGGTER